MGCATLAAACLVFLALCQVRGSHKKKGCVGAKAPTLFIEKISLYEPTEARLPIGAGSAVREGLLNRPGFRPRPFFWLFLTAHEDPVSEVFKVPVSIGIPLDHFDLVVCSFGEAVGVRMVKSVQDVF